MQIPSRQDINVFDSLDERSACKHFLGKSVEDAELLFREISLHYQEDLLWMGPVAFRYYIFAALRYVQSAEATGDSDIVRSLAFILEFRLKNEPSEIIAIAEALSSFCAYIVEHYERFDVDLNLDGDVQSRYEKLASIFLQMTHP